MEQYRTEEEQVEALKKWWQENSRSTFLAIALALGAGFGWQGWQQHQLEQAESASASYEELLQALGGGEQSTDEQRATARHLATRLKTDHAGSTYAQFAALHLAKLAVEDEDLASAETELRWVLTRSPEPEMKLIAQLRLARVVAAQGDVDAALKMVGVQETGAFAASYAEAEGDFHLLQNNESLAREAYLRAQALQAGNPAASGSVSVKLQALSPVPARELAMVEPEAAADAEINEGQAEAAGSEE